VHDPTQSGPPRTALPLQQRDVRNAPLFYGLICVFMAMLLGWISSVLFPGPA
jgi:hypothetical protein